MRNHNWKTMWKHVLSTNFPWTKMSSACFNQLQDQYHHESNDFWSHLSGSREFATTASTRDLQCHGGIPACFAEGEQKGRTHVMLWIDRLFKKVWKIGMWWECIRIAMPVLFWKSSVAGIPLSYEFSEVIEAVELCFKNLKNNSWDSTNQTNHECKNKWLTHCFVQVFFLGSFDICHIILEDCCFQPMERQVECFGTTAPGLEFRWSSLTGRSFMKRFSNAFYDVEFLWESCNTE